MSELLKNPCLSYLPISISGEFNFNRLPQGSLPEVIVNYLKAVFSVYLIGTAACFPGFKGMGKCGGTVKILRQAFILSR
jgi:hypothetical protein